MPRAARTHKKKSRIDERPTAAERGYGARWQKRRRWYLRRNPLCVECLRDGVTTAATHVDHIVPHKGDPVKMWDEDNWQSLCESHHNQKSAREKGRGGKISTKN